MKNILSGSVGFLFFMSMVGCAYHPGTYDPHSGCTVGSGWEIGCLPAPCHRHHTLGCQAPGCQVPVHQASNYHGVSGGHYGGNQNGGNQSCGHSGCFGLNGCILNPLTWVNRIFCSLCGCHHHNQSCSSSCGIGCSSHGNGCPSGSCSSGYQGGYQAPQYQAPYQVGPAPVVPHQSVPQPVTAKPVYHNYQLTSYQPSSSNKPSYVVLPAGATIVNTPHWVPVNP